jgi:dihydrofolate reductase
MHQPILSAIAAIQQADRGIGYQNDLLYKIRGDLQWFKKLTTGHPIIMGRKTFDSIGKPLPNRTTIVVTRNKAWQHEGVLIASTIEEAVSKAKEIEKEELFIIGGAEIFNQAFPFIDRLYLTVVEASKPADTFFPSYESTFKKVIKESEPLVDPETQLHYRHLVLDR